ncbi:MAG: DUF4363 family protein [Clostridiales bacterium]|nr:DUF4363 family protein [Clostridiales bacterium]
MVKQMIAAIIIFAVMLGAGFAELFVVKSNFDNLKTQLEHNYTLAENKTITEKDFDVVYNSWKETREKVEFFLNHTDLAELNYRMSECLSYVKNKKYDEAMAYMQVLIDICEHLPHQIVPTPEHIF